ncbi:MAG: adenosylhomocysteinase, partial [Thaumarchaeota archaeon S15]
MARAGSSRIRDAGLAPRGRALHDWAAARMGALRSAASSLGSRPLAGLTVAFCLQVTPETSVLVLEAMGLGARAVACAGNPHTTSDAIAAHLAASGATVHAWAGQGAREFAACARRAGPRIVGGTEETTTGVRRMRALFARHEARYPIIAVNDARTKATFDNAYGTGQSAVDALMRSCGLLVASRAAVVAGYGPVGRGVAARLGGLGAR